MPEHLQATQTTGPTGSTAPEIRLADLLSHPALAGLQPNDRAALHLAAEQLERRAAAGVTLHLHLAHVGHLVPVGLLDARAAVYSTTAPRGAHGWLRAPAVTAPVVLDALAAAAGLLLSPDPWGAVALPGLATLNTIDVPLDDNVLPMVVLHADGKVEHAS